MSYIPEESKVVYQSKDDKEEKVFDALEWLAAMCSHVPNKGEQMVRYYGFYSNVSRGKRKMQDQDELIPSILEPVEDPDFNGDGSSKERRKNWARLIQKVYETDPLCCPKCSGAMRVVSVIEDEEVIKKIFKHLGLWEVKARPPPKKKIRENETVTDYSESQLLPSDDYLYARTRNLPMFSAQANILKVFLPDFEIVRGVDRTGNAFVLENQPSLHDQ